VEDKRTTNANNIKSTMVIRTSILMFDNFVQRILRVVCLSVKALFKSIHAYFSSIHPYTL